MLRAGHAVDEHGRDVSLPHLERLALPITFLAGEDDTFFLPKGSETTYQRLRQVNAPDLYERHVIAGYSHLDCLIGKDAPRDVFPLILHALERGD